jgi:putative nucleotidyltransferase with HDIG domain
MPVMTTTHQQAMAKLRAASMSVGELVPVPVVALKALQATKDPNTTAKQLQLIIGQDQALAARILRIVNSAMYGLSRTVSTIAHAVTVLGMQTLRSVLMAAAVQHAFDHARARGQDLTARLLMEHSWGAALAARCLALRVRYENPDEAFLCGLMHDIGKPVLLRNYPGHYLQVISDAYRARTTFHERELSLLGFSHAHVGALLSEKWNFPPQMAAAIAFHHTPGAAPAYRKLVSVVALADLIMVHLGVGLRRDNNLELEKQEATGLLNLNGAILELALADIRAARVQVPDPTSL